MSITGKSAEADFFCGKFRKMQISDIFLLLRTCSVFLRVYFCTEIENEPLKLIVQIMNENVLSLVMDTIGIVGMIFVAGVLLCV